MPGVLSAAAARRTAAYIAEHQLPSGMIPWFRGHHADPWDHVEAAMALDVAGLHAEARHAYEWSARTQSASGGWPMEIVEDDAGVRVTEPAVDTNQAAYLAVGVWHHWLVTGDRRFVEAMWPNVRGAIDLACDLQQPGGGISWSRDDAGTPAAETLLTGSACTVLSLRCALALADVLADAQPDWELAAARLAHAVAVHPDGFADRSRYSMDWYYPVLGGAVRGGRGRDLVRARWAEFVVPGRGIRCVADRPWVTAAETCELVLTLDTLGDGAGARRLLQNVQFLRDGDGGYWTGWVFPEEVVWPEEKTTWTAAAVLLAADALAGHTRAAGLFRGGGLPAIWPRFDCDARCSDAVTAP